MAFRSLRHTLAALLVLLSLATGVQAAVQVRITPASTTTLAGSTITLTVEADSVTDLGGFQFGFSYNPANLQALSSTISPAFDQIVAQNVGSGSGLIAATVFTNAPVSGAPVTLATVDFTVLTAATSTVTLTNVVLGQIGGTEILSTSSGATIIADSFTITATAGGGGTISPSGLTTLSIGGTQSYAITAGTGFHIVDVLVDGVLQGAIGSYTFAGVSANHTIDATFAPDPVNGVCGTSISAAFKTAPASNLCAAGTATSVSGTGPWSWSCSGSNGGATAPCTAAVDTTGPSLTVSSLANGAITNNATLNVAGTVVDASGVTGLTINGATVTVTGGSFSYPVTLQAGPNSVISIATNTFGFSTTDSRIITLDTTAPILTVTSPADNSTTAQQLALVTGTVNEASTATVTLNSGTPQSASMAGNAYSATVSLAAGLNTIAVTATDLAGNASNTSTRSVAYDNTTPSLAVTNPIQDITTAQGSLTVTGTVSDTITAASVTISFNGQTMAQTVINGTFSQLLTFPTEGVWPVSVTAIDEAGNSSTVVRNIIYALPVNGSCGTSNNSSLATAPVNSLCSSGTASTVTGTGPWNWTCSGIYGGATASCSSSISTRTITATAAAGGIITPSGSATINLGADQTCTITPDSGFIIADVKVDGVSQGAISSYTFANVTASHTIEALFTRPDGVLDPANTTGVPAIKDALMALGFATGEAAPNPAQLRRGDTSPMINGVPYPDGKIDLGDVLVILRKVVGLAL